MHIRGSYIPLALKGRKNGQQKTAGLSLRGGGWGFPPATLSVIPSYFHRKIEEK